jgi:hypothetical protein
LIFGFLFTKIKENKVDDIDDIAVDINDDIIDIAVDIVDIVLPSGC